MSYYICEDCHEVFKTVSALKSHRRHRHAGGGRWGLNRMALESTLRELELAERLSPVDAAKIQAARSLADAVDAEMTNAYLWRTYREALDALLEEHDDADSFERLLAEINSATDMGHPAAT